VRAGQASAGTSEARDCDMASGLGTVDAAILAAKLAK
jgi:hypothetical protein